MTALSFPALLVESDATTSHLPPSVVVANTAVSGFRLNSPSTRPLTLYTEMSCLAVEWKHVVRRWGKIYTAYTSITLPGAAESLVSENVTIRKRSGRRSSVSVN